MGQNGILRRVGNQPFRVGTERRRFPTAAQCALNSCAKAASLPHIGQQRCNFYVPHPRLISFEKPTLQYNGRLKPAEDDGLAVRFPQPVDGAGQCERFRSARGGRAE